MKSSSFFTSIKTPIISVVMCVYNREAFLPTAIQSVLQQTLHDFELLLIEDGSTDNSRAIVRSFAARDPRITAIFQDHSGAIASYNTGCANARGKYIAILDADDIAVSSRLELQSERMDSCPDLALLGGSTQCIDSNGDPLFVMRWPSKCQGLYHYLLMDCVIAHTTVIFRRDVFLSVGGYRTMYKSAADYDFFLRIADRYMIDNVSEILCQYRLHDQQVSALNYTQQVISGIGARLATRARRSNRPEPQWLSCPISADDLISNGVTPQRIATLRAQFESSIVSHTEGWRWSKLPFLDRTVA